MRSEILCCYMVLAMLLGGSLLVIHADATVNILPLGDSITRGGTSADSPYPSYRYLLWNYLKTGGYDVNFIGSTTFPTFSSFSFDQNHEGHGGYTTATELSGDSSDDSQAKLSNWLKLYTPDIVLLHIGTNDVIQQVPVSQRLSNVGQIIDTLRADNPNVKILLAQIIPTGDTFRNQNSGLIAYNNAIPALAAQKSTTQSPVIVVDQYSGYNGFSDNQYDGIHPKTSGEKKMADRWYAALVPLLGGGSVTPGPTPTPTTSPWDSPQAIPGSIQAADYASGGEGVAYHDTTTGNQGGAYRNDDVDIEYSSVEQEFVVGYIRSGEWLTYDVNVASGGIYTVNFRVSSPYTGSTIDLEVDGSEVTMIQVPNTGAHDLFTTVQRPVYLPGGHHTLKLDFEGSSNLNYIKFTSGMPTPTGTSTPVPTGTTVSPTGSQTVIPTTTTAGVERPYVAHSFPCRVEAEDYDLGGEGIAYHDTTLTNLGGEYRSDDVDIEATPGGGLNVGYIRNGEWLAYTVTVPVTRTYVATFRSSSWAPGRSILVQVDGTPVTAVGVPNTNSSSVYDTAQVSLPMAQGVHRITLTFNGDGQNLDWFDVTNDVPTTATTTAPTTTATTVTTKPTTTVTTVPPTTVPTTVVTTVQPTQTSRPYVTHRPPTRIEAEDYDQGGEGVAYHDTTLGNLGGQYRKDDVDIETIAAGGYDIGYVKDGEWLTYTIDVPSTSAYTAVFRVSSWGAGRSIGVSVDGAQAATVPVAMTGSYSSFTLSVVSFTMTQGTHTVRLTFNGDSQNLDYFDLIPGNYATTTVPTTVPTTAATTVATTVPTTAPTTTVTTVKPTTVATTTVATTATTVPITTVPLTTTPAPSGTVWQIPTRIEAENYDLGGENVAYHDTTTGNLGGQYRQDDVDIEAMSAGGYNVCWIRDGEWLRYHVSVPNTGVYTATFRVGSWSQGKAITIEVDGVGAAVAAVPNTGSNSVFTTTAAALPLTAGAHTITLTFNGDGQNLDWFALENGMIQTTTPTTAPPTTVATTVKPTTAPTTIVTTVKPTTVATTVKPTTVTPTTAPPTIPTITIGTTATTLPLPDTKAYKSLALPGRLQAEDYDNGGEGGGYHDTTIGNQGGAYRNDDADVESLIDGSGYDVCWIRDGEWLKYTVNIQESRDYGATFRVASPQVGGQCELKIDGTSEVTINVPNTGSFDAYQTIGTRLPLTAGQHTITMIFHGSRMNVDYIEFF